MSLPPDDDMPPLEELSHKIQSAKHKHDEREAAEHASSLNPMRVGVELLSGVLVGTVMGYFIDKWLDSFPIAFLICFFLGAIAGGLNIYKMTKHNTDPT